MLHHEFFLLDKPHCNPVTHARVVLLVVVLPCGQGHSFSTLSEIEESLAESEDWAIVIYIEV